MSDITLEDLLSEDRVFQPPDEFAGSANAGPGIYDEATDWEAWWMEQALNRITWYSEPAIGLDDSNPPFLKWFEAGTPNIAGVVGFAAAIDYLEKLGMDKIRQHEIEITKYALVQLSKIKNLEIQGPTDPLIRGAAVSFTDPDIHPHDISTFLDSKGIAIRAGHHCAQPLLRLLGKVATARASFYIYNDESDVDKLVEAILEMKKYFVV